jgi:fructokinase
VTRDYRARSGQQRTAIEIAEAAADDSLAIECLVLYQDRLARSLASIINVLDPDAIVLGGGLTHGVPNQRLSSHLDEKWALL